MSASDAVKALKGGKLELSFPEKVNDFSNFPSIMGLKSLAQYIHELGASYKAALGCAVSVPQRKHGCTSANTFHQDT